MADGTKHGLDGRLIAHRQLLSLVVAALAETPQGAPIRAFLEERSVFQGGEEDPGVLPSGAHAIELALADELRLIAERSQGSAAGV
ncbi:MAG: hypothetical protein H0T41_06250 [Rhodobacteraceae bacterium]|nr:hypothetical protein [Paracoccaceae bacterium]